MDHLDHPESTWRWQGDLKEWINVDYGWFFNGLFFCYKQLPLSRGLAIEHQQKFVCPFLETWVFEWSFVNSANFRLLTEGLANFQIGCVYSYSLCQFFGQNYFWVGREIYSQSSNSKYTKYSNYHRRQYRIEGLWGGWITQNHTATCSKFHGESCDHLWFFHFFTSHFCIQHLRWHSWLVLGFWSRGCQVVMWRA